LRDTTLLVASANVLNVKHIVTSGLSATPERNAAGVLAHIILVPARIQRMRQNADVAIAVAPTQLGARVAK